jgi:PAT family beta-lactamase induction signal transducer AmpG
MLFLGFSAGLPLLLILGTLSFWLREAGIDRSTIGYLTWVGLIYAFKWVWAPLVDRLQIPLLTKLFGRRRSWLLFAQALIVIGLLGMSTLDPKLALNSVVWCAFLWPLDLQPKILPWMHFELNQQIVIIRQL